LLKRRFVVVPLLSLALMPAPPPALAESEGFVVVVNASNAVSEVPQDLLARIFLRKARRWPGGQSALPVDQSMVSPLRLAFSRKVLGLAPAEVRDYWMKQTLSGGEVAPAIRGTDQEVLTLVKSETGAIAYVSADSTLPDGVKVVKVKQ
jgi:ABC-type phosphate transport system substrate-binding protein